jgi:hypothetical protein
VDLQCTPGAEGFWARRARTSVDVLGPGVLVGRVVVLGCSSEGSSEDSSLASVTGIFKIVKCLPNFNLYANYYVDLNCYANCFGKCYFIYQNLGFNMLE